MHFLKVLVILSLICANKKKKSFVLNYSKKLYFTVMINQFTVTFENIGKYKTKVQYSSEKL